MMSTSGKSWTGVWGRRARTSPIIANAVPVLTYCGSSTLLKFLQYWATSSGDNPVAGVEMPGVPPETPPPPVTPTWPEDPLVDPPTRPLCPPDPEAVPAGPVALPLWLDDAAGADVSPLGELVAPEWSGPEPNSVTLPQALRESAAAAISDRSSAIRRFVVLFMVRFT